ncbi:hypothetical protein ABEF95_009068 [Exophiala dermatitidis]
MTGDNSYIPLTTMTWDQQNQIADNESPDTASLGSCDHVSGVLASSSSLGTGNGSGRESGISQRPGPPQQQPATQQSQAQHKTRTLAPNLTRRSHKKSRGGCYSCKNRKIKCGEQKPTCSSCALKGLTCIYPTDTTSRNNHNKSTMTTAQPLPVLRRNPTTGPSFAGDPGGIEGETSTSFSMLDMRFFHHFLTMAFPHLPVDNDSVWVHEIPQFAEQHGYLMHAILSLGASHLGRLTGVDYRRESLVHRGQALAGLNRALSHQQGTLRYGESDAMLASCYALTFQASYMGDGLADFITMVRGCALTTSKILQDQAPTAFKLDPESHFRFMSPRLHRLPAVDPQHLREGHQALQHISDALNLNLSSFATTTTTTDREAEVNFHAALVDVIVGLQTSPATGYLHFMAVYTVWAGLGHDSFKSFLDPDNLVAQLLLAYFVAIQLLMVPLATHEWGRHRPAADQARARARVLFGVVEWAHSIFKHLGPTELNVHLEWPRKIVAIANAEIRGLLLQSPPVLQLHLTPTTETDDTDDGLGIGVVVAAADIDPETVADLNQLCAAHRQLYTTP